MTYYLELPTSSWVHLVFHVFRLNKLIGDNIPIQNVFLDLDEEKKSSWDLKKYRKQGPSDYEIKLLLGTSSNGRTYQ